MPKKNTTRKNGQGKLKLTKQQEQELAALDELPEPVTEMAKALDEAARKLILSGEHHRSGHIVREIMGRR